MSRLNLVRNILTTNLQFRESVWQPDGKPLVTQTKRYITAKSSCTHSYIVTAANGDGIVTLDPSPSVDFYSYLLGNASDDSNSSYTAPYEWLTTWQAFGTTLYSNPSLNRNASERAADREGEGGFPNVPCGPRCGYIEVFRFTRGKEWDDRNSRGDYFLCTTEVSTVFGATQKEHELPDMMAVRAASAIGSSAVYDGNSGAQVSVYNDA